MSAFLEVTRDELARRIPGILQEYGIRSNFPIRLTEGVRHYPEETAHIGFARGTRNLPEALLVYQRPIPLGPIYHEIGHVKMRCFGMPAFRTRDDMPRPIEYIYAMCEEYYVRLLMDNLFPTMSRELMEREVGNMPSVEACRSEAEAFPALRSSDWFKDMYNIMRLVQDERVCAKSPNLTHLTPDVATRIAQFVGSSVATNIAEIGEGFQSLPELPPRSGRFSSGGRAAIIRTIEGWFACICADAVEPLAEETYTIDCVGASSLRQRLWRLTMKRDSVEEVAGSGS